MAPLGEDVFYANAVTISVIPTDVAICFGFTSPAAQEGGRVRVAWIHVSPALAKVLTRVLSDAVARYEAEIGPLPEVVQEAEAGGGPDQGPASRGSAH